MALSRAGFSKKATLGAGIPKADIKEEAQKQIGIIAGRAGAVLAGHAPVTVPIAKANMQFYRARFAGFDEAKAQATCLSLKAQKIECIVMRAE